MLRTIGKTVGGTLAVLCLASTLVTAQGQAQKMTCTRDNGKRQCTAATGTDGKEIVVVGEDLVMGTLMTCVDTGNVVKCKPAA